jgi:uncharacterized protein
MNKDTEIKQWVDNLKLAPHPEGGFYKETYRSDLVIETHNFSGSRNVCTGIYFLIIKGNFSAFHRIKSDEMWHFYSGDPLVVHVILPNGKYYSLLIGVDMAQGQTPQAVVPAGAWFASESLGDYSLVGCTVAPGFDFDDFELADRKTLFEAFPQHKILIDRLTR